MSWLGKWNSNGAKGSMSVREGTELVLGGFMEMEFVEGEGVFMVIFTV